MNKVQFDEIINFAIGNEEEAVKFYQDLQTKTKFQVQKDMLKDFENMEKGHIRILENIRSRGMGDLRIKETQDLHIADYIVDVEPYENMDYQDILIVAMKKEEKARQLYTDMAKEMSGTEAEQLFVKLATEEAGHKHKFEELYDEYVLKEN